jgi:hypothetical protein
MNNPAISQRYRPTEDLTWEKNRIWNIGMDMRMYMDRIRFSIEYYDRKSRDLLRMVPVSGASGHSTMLMNTGAGIHNTGLELEARAHAVRKGNHSLDVNFNIAFQKSTHYGLDVQEMDASNQNQQIMANGHSVHSWYMREFGGVDPTTGQILYVGYDENGNRFLSTNTADVTFQILGQGIPKVMGGFSMNYTYGQLTLSVLCSYGFGHHIYDRIAWRNAAHPANDFTMTIDHLDRWTPDTPNASSPLRVRDGAIGSRHSGYLKKGDYLKIRNIRLQYALPEKTTKAMRLSAAMVFVQAEQPFIFSHIPGYDPELSLTGYRTVGSYPSVSTFTAGFSINF